jgi:hypothetical protein
MRHSRPGRDLPFNHRRTSYENGSHDQTPEKIATEQLENHCSKNSLSCVKVGDSEYLISRPIVSPVSIASRGTRGYWPISVSDRKVMLLKDTWRYLVEGMDSEGKIVEVLN